MSKDELQALYCTVSNYKSAVEDVEFIDSWRFVDFRDKYLEAAPTILGLIKQLQEKQDE